MPAAKKRLSQRPLSIGVEKCPTGIMGFDEITGGGLPRGRPTLISGRAGSGKTLFGIEFIARGARLFGEPGVVMTFEETGRELIDNFASLGFDLTGLIKQKKVLFDFVSVERGEIEETGAYDLNGIFARLEYAINEVKARRVFLDTIEALFSGLSSEAILRAELRRLFHWLKEKGVTAVITGERGEKLITRHGLEEYVADCVILLDHAIEGHIATRRLRVVKYRGSAHGTDEFPFLIDEGGISVMPVTSLALIKHTSSTETISSGLPRLDTMLGGKGFYRGSSILVSGTPGSGKSTLAAFSNLKKICEEHLAGSYTIEIVDLVKNPQLARGDQIFAVPTLVRNLPPPMKKIIGDLSNTERVLVGLDIRGESTEKSQ